MSSFECTSSTCASSAMPGSYAPPGLSSQIRSGSSTSSSWRTATIKKRPDPFLEFALGWLARNRVDNQGRESAVVWDAGQFHHLDGRIVAVLDIEFAHVGDPMMDLGGMWIRNAFIPFGDVPALFRRYQDRSGRPVDIASVQYHYILWALSNPIEFHAVLADPVPGADYMLNLHWVIESNLLALEGIAHVMGVELEEVQEPDPIASPFGPAHRHLVKSLEDYPPGSGYDRYRHRMSVRLARHLERVDELGAAVVSADLDDLHRLLGRRPGSWSESEIELERFVLSDNGRRDAELIEVFHRRLHRARMLCGPCRIVDHTASPRRTTEAVDPKADSGTTLAGPRSP